MNFRINSIAELKTIIEDVRGYRCEVMMNSGRLICEMYRGQGRNSWRLEPNIVRANKDLAHLQLIERRMISDFHQELVKHKLSHTIQGGFLKGKFHSDWLLIQQAQHYGLPTRFMDWSGKWEVALFFAVSNPFDDDYDADFWIYFVQPEDMLVDDDQANYLEVDPYSYAKTSFLNPSGYLSDDYLSKVAMRRVARQHGKFLIQPYSKLLTPLEVDPAHIKHLHRVTIPKEIKASLRNELTLTKYTNTDLYIVDEPIIGQIRNYLRVKYTV